jgi:hypothetical protein
MTAFSAARSLLVAALGFLVGLAFAALAVPLAARAAPPVPTPTPEHREVNIIVYGADPGPTGKDDEIVVCSRQPESERYRIPKRFRGQKAAASPAGNSWANKVQSTDDASRMAAGVPNNCSAVGTGGQSGCYAQFLNQQARLRQQQKQQQEDNPNGIPQ